MDPKANFDFETKDTEKVYESLIKALTPDPILSVSEWADKHRILSRKSAAEPGRWRTSRTPYLKEIMDCLSIFHPAKDVSFKKASQVGGTEAGLNWLGYIIDHAPGPTITVWPRVDDGKKNSKLRIDPLIEENPRLKSKVGTQKSRDSSNTLLQKSFIGGELVITGANSAAGLKSMPARYKFMDEIDEYPHDVEGQGDPIELIEARSRTFSRTKSFKASTPTVKGASKIEDEYEISDQRKYYVPCPECDHEQTLEFKNLDYDWDKTAREITRAEYACEGCGILIEEFKKTTMLSKGRWVAKHPERSRVGFFINSLYSPVGWYSWAEICKKYEEAKHQIKTEKKHEKMKTFVNTTLGETYEEPGDAPEWQKIYHRREDYKINTAPKGVILITCGADVQGDRIEYEILGHGRNGETWSIDYKVLVGDTANEEVWKKFKNVINSSIEMEGGKFAPITFTCVDSGFRTSTVYDFSRQFPTNKLAPVKGTQNLAMPVGMPKLIDFTHRGRQYKRGVRLWTVGTNVIKTDVYARLKIEPNIESSKVPKNYCHFPEYEGEYFKQLTAEKIVTKRDRKGFTVTEFVKERERNEALDCRVYAMAAASIIGIERFKDSDWSRYEGKMILAKTKQNGNTKQVTKRTTANASKRKEERAKKRAEFKMW